MPYNINLDPTQSYSESTSNDLPYVDWDFSPGETITITHVAGQPNPDPLDVAIIIKDFLAIDPSDDNSYHVRVFQSANMPYVLSGELSTAMTADPIIGYQLTSSNLEVVSTINFQDMSILSEGWHNSGVEINVHKKPASSSGPWTFVEEKFLRIKINVINSQSILVLPEALNFSHVLGEALPASQNIEVTVPGTFFIRAYTPFVLSGGNITVVSSTALQTTYSGSGAQTLTVSLTASVEPLTVGAYEMSLDYYINTYPNNSGSVGLNLFVFEENAIFVNPEQLEFSAIPYIYEADIQQLFIQAPGAITVTGPLWLNLFNDSGTNNLAVTVKPVLSNNLSIGVYEGVITIAANGITLEVPVVYNVLDNMDLQLLTDGINFTDNLKAISTFYSTADFKVILDLRTKIYNYGSLISSEKTIQYKLAIFNNQTQFLVGKPLNNIMAELEDLHDINMDNLSPNSFYDNVTFFRNYYLPAEVNLQVGFLEYSAESPTGTTTAIGVIVGGLYFLKGRKPLKLFPNAVILDFYSEPLRVTPNSFALFNFYKTQNHSLRVYKNNEFIISLPHNIGSHKVFAHRHQFSNYAPGDVIEIRLYKNLETLPDDAFYENSSNYLSQKYIVFPEGKRSYHIGWESEYGCLDLMEFTGDITFKLGYESKVVDSIKNFVKRLRKVDSKRSQTVTINTGFILKNNTKQLDGLLDAGRAWIMSDTEESVALVPIGKTLANYDSDQELYGYDVEFQINLNDDNKINS